MATYLMEKTVAMNSPCLLPSNNVCLQLPAHKDFFFPEFRLLNVKSLNFQMFVINSIFLRHWVNKCATAVAISGIKAFS